MPAVEQTLTIEPLPWRFICVPQDQRSRLGDAFAQALLERDPAATDEQVSQARDKALRAPVLLLLVTPQLLGARIADDNDPVLHVFPSQ